MLPRGSGFRTAGWLLAWGLSWGIGPPARPVAAGEPAGAAEPASPPPVRPNGLDAWLGLPDWLDLGLTFTAEPLVNPLGGTHRQAGWMQQLTVQASLAPGGAAPAGAQREIDRWRLHLQFNAFSGDADLASRIGAVIPLQTVAHPTGLWWSEASLERQPTPGAPALRFGLMPVDPELLAVPALQSYVHSALNDTFNLTAAGWPIDPLAAFGLRLRWPLDAQSDLRFGAFLLDGQTRMASLLGVDPGQPDLAGSLLVLEWRSRRTPGLRRAGSRLRFAHPEPEALLPEPLLQIGGYVGSIQLISPLPGQGDGGPDRGLYASLTLPLSLPVGRDHRLWLAARGGFDPASDPAPLFLGAGWLAQGLLPDRPRDVLAIGFARTGFSSLLLPGAGAGGVVELNYSVQFSSGLTLQPVLQWILNPASPPGTPDILAAGLQLQWQF